MNIQFDPTSEIAVLFDENKQSIRFVQHGKKLNPLFVLGLLNTGKWNVTYESKLTEQAQDRDSPFLDGTAWYPPLYTKQETVKIIPVTQPSAQSHTPVR